MDTFNYIELRNIIHKHAIDEIPFDESQIDELQDIVASYKIDNPCFLDDQDDEQSWIKMTKPFQMTIRDLDSLKHGDVLVIIFLNKEFMNFDTINSDSSDIWPLVVDSEEFFTDKKYKVCKKYIYIHDSGLSGIIQMNKDWKKFDWEVEIMENEFITMKDSASSLNPNLRVGWKGPCMDVKNLKLCPRVIYDL